ncbi:MAG: mycothione reductase [Actinomycetota bacterium]
MTAGKPTEHYDLVIIGSGSGNSIIGPEMDGWCIAMVERGVFGGTCLNRGCIPTKMLVYPADLAVQAGHGDALGVHTRFDGADWSSMVQRIFGRIDPIAESGREYRHRLPNVDVYEGSAHFVGDRELEVLGTRISGEQVVIAAGARSFIPDVPGLDGVPFHTSDSIMRIAHQPRHLVILGGGFIAAEFGHIFDAFGTKVTIVNRGHHLLRAEDDDISRRFTELAALRFDLALGAHIDRVRRTDGGVAVELACDGGSRTIEGDVLLVAAGRIANGDQLRVEAGGIAMDDRGNVVVDAYGRTTAPGVWALGDVNGRHQLKHMANGEARVVRHNLMHPADLREYDTRPAPHAVFSNPQIGAVGLTEREAQARVLATGQPYCTITQDYAGAAYGWAMEDTTSFCKLIGDPLARKVIGAHIIGPQASMLAQLLVQGIHLGSTADEMALGQVWIHPALTEVVEQALLALMNAFDQHDAQATG